MPDRPPNYYDEYRKQRLEDEAFVAQYSHLARAMQGQIFDAERRGAGPTALDFAEADRCERFSNIAKLPEGLARDDWDDLTDEELDNADLERREESGEYDNAGLCEEAN